MCSHPTGARSNSVLAAQVDEVAPKGSSITLFCPDKPKLPHTRRASLTHISGDSSSPSALRELGAHKFDAVVVLQPGRGSEMDDSKLLITLLALEQVREASPAFAHLLAPSHAV